MKNMHIINLTPHAVHLRLAGNVSGAIMDGNGISDVVYPSSGNARVSSVPAPVSPVYDETHRRLMPVVRNSFSATTGLPAPVAGTFYIVSMLVAQANPARMDLLVPDTSPQGAIRNAAGQIEAVRGFQTFCMAYPSPAEDE